jgi:predicted DsbA family dithiol-disulfide isomerase
MEGAPVKDSLLVFADYACPFCYLAEAEVARLRQDGIEVGIAAFELRPAGTPLPSPDERWMQLAWAQSIEPLARRLHLEMRYPRLVPRTRKAHEAVAWARSEGAGRELHEAVYRAYWQDGRDIGRIDVLVDIGAEAGLDRGGMKVSLDIDQWTDRVVDDIELGRRLELGGVPAYLRYRAVDADGVDDGGAGDDGAADADAGAGRGGKPAAELRVGLQQYDELRSWMVRNDV